MINAWKELDLPLDLIQVQPKNVNRGNDNQIDYGAATYNYSERIDIRENVFNILEMINKKEIKGIEIVYGNIPLFFACLVKLNLALQEIGRKHPDININQLENTIVSLKHIKLLKMLLLNLSIDFRFAELYKEMDIKFDSLTEEQKQLCLHPVLADYYRLSFDKRYIALCFEEFIQIVSRLIDFPVEARRVLMKCIKPCEIFDYLGNQKTLTAANKNQNLFVNIIMLLSGMNKKSFDKERTEIFNYFMLFYRANNDNELRFIIKLLEVFHSEKFYSKFKQTKKQHRIIVVDSFLKNNGKQFCEKLYEEFMLDCSQGINLEMALDKVVISFDRVSKEELTRASGDYSIANMAYMSYFPQTANQVQPNCYLFFSAYPMFFPGINYCSAKMEPGIKNISSYSVCSNLKLTFKNKVGKV